MVKIINVFYLCFQLLLIFALLSFALFISKENHSSINFHATYYLLIFSLINYLLNRKQLLKLTVLNLCLTFFLCALILTLEKFNIMMNYDVWIDKGMP
jgi:hypothetical protein